MASVQNFYKEHLSITIIDMYVVKRTKMGIAIHKMEY